MFLKCGDNKGVIAQVENQKISSEYFKKTLEIKFNTWDLSKISQEDRRETLEQLINERLKYLNALDLGLDKEPDFEGIVQRRGNKIVAEKLFQEVIVGKLVSEDLLLKYYQWQQQEVSIQLILLGFQGISRYRGNRSKQKTESLLLEIFEKLRVSGNFEEMVFEYSDDPGKEQTRGILKSYQIGVFGPEADKAVFMSNVGEIIGPFLTKRGFVIFKTLDKKKLEIDRNYEREKKELKRKLFSSYFIDEADKMYVEMSQKFFKKYKPEYNEKNILRVFTYFKENANRLILKHFKIDPEQESITIAHLNDKPVLSGELFDFYSEQFFRSNPAIVSYPQFKNFIQNYLEHKSWIYEAKVRKINQSEEIEKQIEEIKLDELVKIFDQKQIDDMIQIDEDEIISYYEANKSQFVDPEKIQVWSIAVKDKELAKSLEQRARRGEDFENLAEKYTEKLAYKKVGGRMGFQTRNSRFGIIVDQAFEAGPGKIAGPFENGDYYNIIKTGEYVPEQQKELKTIETQIKYALRKEKELKREQEIIEKIRKEYSYSINESNLRRLT
jgi:parvulin-like peptidyl-prolyl isomerase